MFDGRNEQFQSFTKVGISSNKHLQHFDASKRSSMHQKPEF